MKNKYAFYFDANIRKEEFPKKQIESHIKGDIIKTTFIRGTYLASLHDKKLIKYYNILHNSSFKDNIKGYFVTLDRGIYTQVWLDLLVDDKTNLYLNLIEFSLPPKVKTQKRKHWHDDKIRKRDIPKVRKYIKDKILKEVK